MLKHRTSVFVATICLVSAIAHAQTQNSAAVIQRFAGTWKEDISKRKLDTAALNPLRFRKAADGSLEEIRGAGPRENVQKVTFDGTPRELPSGNSVAWRQLGPNSFERVLSAKGQTLATRKLTVSNDGKSMDEDIVTNLTDGGTAKSHFVFERVAGAGVGLEGEWKPISGNVDTAVAMIFEPSGANRLRVAAIGGLSATYEINGAPVPLEGVGASKLAAGQLKAVGDNALVVTDFSNGNVASTTTFTISADGKTMSMVGESASAKPGQSPGVSLTLIKQ